MKDLTKAIKVIFILLVFSFVLVTISSGQGKGKIRGYWMDVIISEITLDCTETELPSAILKVDTTDGCKEAFVTYAYKSLYINTIEHCFELPEPLFSGSGITVQEVELSCMRDRRTGQIVEIQFWLKDTEQNYYRTKILELGIPVHPNPEWFIIHVNHCFEVKPQTKKGKKKPVGYLTVGTIEFRQKNRQ